MKKILHHIIFKKVTIFKWQWNLFGVIIFSAGVFFTLFFLSGHLSIPNIFALAQSSVTKDTDTDFSQGSLSSTAVSGSGAGATVALSGSGTNWWSSSYSARRQITIDITGNGSLASGYTVMGSITGATASSIYSSSLDSGNDFRVVYFDGATNTELTRDLISFSSSSIQFYFKTQASLSGNDSSHYFVYYGYASASTPSVDKTTVYNNTTNAALASSGSVATASDSYTSNPITQVNNGVSGGGPGSVGWGNNNIVGSRTMIKLPASQKVWKVVQRWDGDNTGGWAKPNGQYFPAGYKVQYTTDTNAVASDAPGAAAWNSFTVASDALTASRIDASGSPTYAGSTTVSTDTTTTNSNNCTNCWGTSFVNTFNPTTSLSLRYVFTNTTWLGTMEEFYVYPINGTAATVEPTLSFGSQTGSLATSGTWESATDSNVMDLVWNGGWGDGSSGSSTAFSATLSNLSATQIVEFAIRTASTSNGLSSATYATIGTATTGTTFTATKAQMDALSGVSTGSSGRYIQIKATFTQSAGTSPQLDSFVIYYQSDNTRPTAASSPSMKRTAGGTSVIDGGWTNGTSPYFSWTAGTDADSGIKGYCLYVGPSSSGDPAVDKGLLGTGNTSTADSTCQFIISTTSIDFVTSSYKGSTWLTTSSSPYYIIIKSIDTANNISSSSVSFSFKFDGTAPTNVAYISAASGSFGNVTDMNFNWPISGGSAASDSNSDVLGYQYQLNGSSGTWLGTSSDATCGVSYIPKASSSYTFTALQDENNVVTGANVIYFRAVDTACNMSSDATIRTASISYGGAAPTFDLSCESSSGITVSPSTSTTNSFSLSWNAATPSAGRTVAKYYYMINTSPPSGYSTITSNTATYLSNSTSTSVATGVLTGSVRGTNSVYVVSVDDQNNYSSSNCVKGTYTLNSTSPDPPLNVAATDASVKSASLWRASLGWDVPSYKGTGSLTYKIQRSSDNSTWTDVTTTTGTSYIDTVTSSAKYYWRVGSYDSSSQSQADPSYATSVSLTPKGTYSSAASLSSGPTVSSVTTKKAKITWSTSRKSDSKVAYGTSAGSYFDEEPSNSDQVTDHAINLTNLSPGTTYYYKVKWTDEDGNTGTSDEKNFSTDPAPVVTDPNAKAIGIDSVTIQYTVKGATKVKIYYGKTSSFGGSEEVATSTSETTYTTELPDLEDGTKYYYKINMFDSEGSEYEGSTLIFETLPRPKISNIRFQEVKGSTQPAVLVSWISNTSISSIITYYPEGNAALAKDQVQITLKTGEHKMVVKDLSAQTTYFLQVKGRDKAGNEALSDLQKMTTSLDTRPPQILNIKSEGSSTPSTSDQQSTAQLIISWDTDESASAQVEFGEGTGSNYSQKTQEDANLTTNHLVIISNLTPSRVYHFRTISKDKAGNSGKSIDTVTITPQSTSSALDLVIGNLGDAFKFLNGNNH